MKQFLFIFLCAILLLGAISCNKDDYPARNIAETGDITSITAFNVEISGYCHQKNIEGLSVTFGIEYSDSDLTRNASVLYASEMDENGLFSVYVDNLNPGTEYFYRTFVVYNRKYSFGDVKSFTSSAHPEPEKIDLGTGIKWASFNISTSAPADYGKYYSWGEVKTKSFYAWESYLWTTDDVALRELGGSWRTPTAEEFDRLVSDCYWQWFENYRNSGVKGYAVFRLKNDGATYSPDSDVHIFLPAAGYASKDELHDIGSNGNYWTSTPSTSDPESAYYIYFDSDNINVDECEKRYYGQSIRPVSN